MSLTALQARVLAKRRRDAEAAQPCFALHRKSEIARAMAETTKPAEPVVLSKNDITFDMLNERQRQAVSLFANPLSDKVLAQGSFVLNGPAGTGKTTSVKMGVAAALQARVARRFPHRKSEDEHGSERLNDLQVQKSEQDCYIVGDDEYFGGGGVLVRGAPRIAVVSYTNVAVRNIKEIMPEELRPHCTSIHKLLGYYPAEVTSTDNDPNSKTYGLDKTRQLFIPRYGCEPKSWGGRGLGDGAKLAHLDLVVIEESGTVPVWLFQTLLSALPYPEKTRFVFLGDIEQLDPAFGDGILGFKIVELPLVTLTETYRNVGLVTQLAHRILTGKPMGPLEAETWNKEDDSGKLEFRPFKRATDAVSACKAMGAVFKKQVLEGDWHENRDVVIVPFNKQFGSIELNKWLMQGVVERDKLEVQEVIAGFEHYYMFIGMRFMFNKILYEVTKLEANDGYSGTKRPFPPTRFLDMWGRRRMPRRDNEDEVEAYELERVKFAHYFSREAQKAASEEDVLKLLEQAYKPEDEKRSLAASHVIHAKPVTFSGEDSVQATEIKVQNGKDLHEFVLPYALTCHKAQGSEWRNVHAIMHQSHGIALKREWFYTAVTRARRNLTLYYSDVKTTGSTTHDSLTKAIVNQAIPGRNIEEKLEHFKKKLQMEQKKAELRAARGEYQEALQLEEDENE